MLLVHVTVAYNSPGELETLLKKLEFQDEEIHHIICIDNSSADYQKMNEAVCYKYDSHPGFQIEYFPLSKNFGSATGFAVGMQLARDVGADYVWLHDQDGFPYPTCLQIVKGYFNADNFIISPQIRDENDTYLYSFHGTYDQHFNFYPIELNKKCLSADVAGTAGLIIKADLIDRIGVYDYVNFFIGFEDFDYCLRAGRAGFKVCVIREALYHHPNKWGKHSKYNIKNPPRSFEIIKPHDMKVYKARQFINYYIIHYRHKFMLVFLYSLIRALIKKTLLRPISLIPTLRQYFIALAARHRSGKIVKIKIDDYLNTPASNSRIMRF